MRFDCVDLDPRAIEYARVLNRSHLDTISFACQNVLRFRPERTYDLIWAAGLFDYFRDSAFVALAKRLWPAVSPGGRLVIGNFSLSNPTRAYMELGHWCLHHRSGPDLEALMTRAGLAPEEVRIEAESEGVNLFAVGSRAEQAHPADEAPEG